MKKTLITLLALGGLAMGTEETPATPATPANVDWTITDNGDGTVTYSTTLNGNYYIDLGDAAISNGESFSLAVETTASGWANEWGSGLVSTGDPYNSGANYAADNFRLYIGHATKEGQQKVVYTLNNWEYTKTEEDGVSYTDVPAEINETTPLTLGMVFTFVNKTDATDANDYFQIQSSANSDVTYNFTDDNIVRSLNFATLKNYNDTYSLPDDAVTTISITKAVPEPTTATLSLLALASLAARRRRR